MLQQKYKPIPFNYKIMNLTSRICSLLQLITFWLLMSQKYINMAFFLIQKQTNIVLMSFSHVCRSDLSYSTAL